MKKLLGLLSITPLVLTACGSASLNTPPYVPDEPDFDPVDETYSNTTHARFMDEELYTMDITDLNNGNNNYTLVLRSGFTDNIPVECGVYYDDNQTNHKHAATTVISKFNLEPVPTEVGHNFDYTNSSRWLHNPSGYSSNCVLQDHAVITVRPSDNHVVQSEISRVDITLNKDLEVQKIVLDQTQSNGDNFVFDGVYSDGTTTDDHLSLIGFEYLDDTYAEQLFWDFNNANETNAYWRYSQLSTDVTWKESIDKITTMFDGLKLEAAEELFANTSWDATIGGDRIYMENSNEFAKLIVEGIKNATPTI